MKKMLVSTFFGRPRQKNSKRLLPRNKKIKKIRDYKPIKIKRAKNNLERINNMYGSILDSWENKKNNTS